MKALEILLGYGCNEKCSFCSQELSWRKFDGLPFDLVARQLYLAREDGYKSVCFTGGEPTIRPDLPKMIALARKLGFTYVRVQTNGVKLADAAYADSLVAAGATFFRVSLHGHTPQLHDGLVLLPGAFAKAMRGLEGLRGRAGVGINVVLNEKNYRQLPEIVAYFLERGLAEHLVVIYPLYEGDMAVHEAAMKVSMGETAPFLRAAFDVFRKAGAPFPRLLNFTPCVAPELAPWMLSWAAHSAFVVDEQGAPVDLYMASHDDREKVTACGGCVLNDRCLGFKTSYLKRYRAEALPPVLTEAKIRQKGERVLDDPKGLGGERVEIARAVQPVPLSQDPLRVEQINLRLDPATLRLEEERREWTVAHA